MSRVRRVRDYGFAPGILKPGPRNDITDVSGVLVGHRTVVDAKAGHRTGVTAIRPHGGNMFLERVPAGLCIGNGHGKLAGATQIEELGELETPILLVNTLATGRAIEALIDWTLAQPGCEGVTSVNAVVGETNDSPLNNIRERGIRTSDVLQALDDAVADPVQQGSVGAGAGTMAFGLKGGIGSSSRLVPAACGGWCTAALVQANFDGILQIDGRNVGKELAHLWRPDHPAYGSGPGSIMIVVATDAPVSDRNLRRMAFRAMAGIARTGANFSNGSGDYALAFATHPEVRRHHAGKSSLTELRREVNNEAMSALFLATIEAVEEAVYNALFAAESVVEGAPERSAKSLLDRAAGRFSTGGDA